MVTILDAGLTLPGVPYIPYIPYILLLLQSKLPH